MQTNGIFPNNNKEKKMSRLGWFIGGAVAGIVGISAFAIAYENLHPESPSSLASDENTIIADVETVEEETSEADEETKTAETTETDKTGEAILGNLFG